MPEAPLPSSPNAAAVGGSEAQGAAGAQHVDVQRLADKVYSLLLADVKLARKRGDSPTWPRVRGEG